MTDVAKMELTRGKNDTTSITKSNINITGSPSNNKKSRTSVKNIKKVSFSKNIVDTIIVESYKKYNLDMSYDESGKSDTIKCKCLIF
jgi:hypothetical protein